MVFANFSHFKCHIQNMNVGGFYDLNKVPIVYCDKNYIFIHEVTWSVGIRATCRIQHKKHSTQYVLARN
jgi:hypothetical protein